jgi:hypothetical protein
MSECIHCCGTVDYPVCASCECDQADAKPYTEEEWQKECATGEDTDGAKMTALFKQVEDLKTALSIATARADMMESAAYLADGHARKLMDALQTCVGLLTDKCTCVEECGCVPDDIKSLLVKEKE